MSEVFTSFATSRFINHDKVLNALRSLAKQLIAARPDVIAVYLFGSFATGTATPRSDADIVVEAEEGAAGIEDHAREVFSDAPVPVDLFVATRAKLSEARGIAGRVKAEGVLLHRRAPERISEANSHR
ncbi:MAG: nucleotidyltransferase domain-containing protein [Acidobacteria bacterium]|nr:MAG: nucleotidyltransferase domain-containing protein [Acidobacteriota bacterium]